MVWSFSCLPKLVEDCRESGDYILPTCFDQFCWDFVPDRVKFVSEVAYFLLVYRNRLYKWIKQFILCN